MFESWEAMLSYDEDEFRALYRILEDDMPTDIMPYLLRDMHNCLVQYASSRDRTKVYWEGRITQLSQTVSDMGGDIEFDHLYRRYRDLSVLSRVS